MRGYWSWVESELGLRSASSRQGTAMLKRTRSAHRNAAHRQLGIVSLSYGRVECKCKCPKPGKAFLYAQVGVELKVRMWSGRG